MTKEPRKRRGFITDDCDRLYIFTQLYLLELQLQKINSIEIYPKSYFGNPEEEQVLNFGKIFFSRNTTKQIF